MEEVQRDTDFELFMEQIQGDWRVETLTTISLGFDIGDWSQMTLTIRDTGDDSVGYLTSINRPTSEVMDVIWPKNSSWKKNSKTLIGEDGIGGGGSLIRSDNVWLDVSYLEPKLEIVFTISGDFYTRQDSSVTTLIEPTWVFEFVRK